MEVRVGVPSKALVRQVASWTPSRVRPLVSVASNITRAYRGAPHAIPRQPSDTRCCEPRTGIATRVPGAAAAAAASLLLLQASAAGAYEKGAAEFFNPEAYAGRWYEVASLKRGFAGEGQQDCHCTQGIYSLQQDDAEAIRLQVNTFCVHGGPQGRLSGIRGSVSCANPALLQLLPEFESQLEQAEGIAEKCVLRFDSLPFLPAEPYDVIRTNYTSYALVQGAKDTSFVQIYSRTPNPGPEFIAAQKRVLGELGYPAEQIVDTPQDCEEMPPQMLMAAMEAGMKGRDLMPASTPPQQAMRGYDLGPASGIAFDSVRDPLQSIKDIFSLFKM